MTALGASFSPMFSTAVADSFLVSWILRERVVTSRKITLRLGVLGSSVGVAVPPGY
jgi:hypothetical protein